MSLRFVTCAFWVFFRRGVFDSFLSGEYLVMYKGQGTAQKLDNPAGLLLGDALPRHSLDRLNGLFLYKKRVSLCLEETI